MSRKQDEFPDLKVFIKSGACTVIISYTKNGEKITEELSVQVWNEINRKRKKKKKKKNR
jgi:hypothetical protein